MIHNIRLWWAISSLSRELAIRSSSTSTCSEEGQAPAKGRKHGLWHHMKIPSNKRLFFGHSSKFTSTKICQQFCCRSLFTEFRIIHFFISMWHDAIPLAMQDLMISFQHQGFEVRICSPHKSHKEFRVSDAMFFHGKFQSWKRQLVQLKYVLI